MRTCVLLPLPPRPSRPEFPQLNMRPAAHTPAFRHPAPGFTPGPQAPTGSCDRATPPKPQHARSPSHRSFTNICCSSCGPGMALSWLRHAPHGSPRPRYAMTKIVTAAPQHAGGHTPPSHASMPMNQDAHGDAVSDAAHTAKADDSNVGKTVSPV